LPRTKVQYNRQSEIFTLVFGWPVITRTLTKKYINNNQKPNTADYRWKYRVWFLKDTYRVHASPTVTFSAYKTALQIKTH